MHSEQPKLANDVDRRPRTKDGAIAGRGSSRQEHAWPGRLALIGVFLESARLAFLKGKYHQCFLCVAGPLPA